MPATVWLLTGVQIIVGMIFFSAGISKGLRRPSLERMVQQHGLHHPFAIRLASDILITSEIGIGVLLLFAWSDAARTAGAIAAITALLVFAGLSFRLTLLKRPFMCRCSPLLASHTSGAAVAVRNLLLAAMMLPLLLANGARGWTDLWAG